MDLADFETFALVIFCIGLLVFFGLIGAAFYLEKWYGIINCPCRNQGKTKTGISF